jgi:nitrogen fixation-related uncharacterized protein
MDIETKVVNVNMTLPHVEKLAKMIYRAWIFVGLLVVVAFLFGVFVPSFDDTDAPGERSGLRPYTDHGTGCQYLSTSDGALTPRLGADGRPICGKGT